MALKVENLGSVIDKLIAKTLSRDLFWRDAEEPTEYTASSSKFLYFIKSRDEDGLPPFRLQVFAQAMSLTKVIEEVSADLERELQGKFAQLHELAYRSALGLTNSLEIEILNDLDDSSF